MKASYLQYIKVRIICLKSTNFFIIGLKSTKTLSNQSADYVFIIKAIYLHFIKVRNVSLKILKFCLIMFLSDV